MISATLVGLAIFLAPFVLIGYAVSRPEPKSKPAAPRKAFATGTVGGRSVWL